MTKDKLLTMYKIIGRFLLYLHAFHQILVIYFLFPAYVVINNMVIRIDVIYPFSEKENLPPYCIVVVVLCNNVVVDSTYVSCMYIQVEDITQSCKMQACQTFQRFITMHGVCVAWL